MERLNPESDLRPYQARAVQGLRLGLGAGHKRLMLASPTGSGKTEIAIAIVRGAVAKGKRVAFLANRIELVKQAVKRFRLSGVDCGIIQGENTFREYMPVVVCSIQTVAKRGLGDFDLIVIDEAHGVAGSEAYRNLMEIAKGKPVIGLTATPFSRGLGKRYESLGGPLFESMVVAATIGELIDGGFLVDIDVYAPGEPDMTGVKQSRNAFGEMDWSDMEVGKAADKPELVGDIVTHWIRLAKGTPTVCFAASIAHSKHIVERFLSFKIPAEHIDCYTKDDEREAILKRVATGETLVISNVGILCEGWDFPACKTLILARPTKSLVRYIQMAGRVLRPFEGKDRALILDHSGSVARLGFPTDELPMVLNAGAPKKSSGSRQERDAPLPKPCTACHFVKPERVHKCPKCGHVPVQPSGVIEVEGHLQLVKRPKMTMAEKQQFYSELIAIQVSRGYARGWASRSYRDKVGVWPKGLQENACEPSQETKNFVKSKLIRYAKGVGNAA